jgi:UDP-N-acetylmuramoylalanine--D-glutamate ligase
VLLNITEDHLDRYRDMDDYADSKMIIFKNQKENDFAIINAADTLTMKRADLIKSARVYINEKEPSARSASFENGRMILKSPEKGEAVINISGYRLKGIHNLENLAASALATWLSGATAEGIQKTVDTFRGLPHRVEFCGEVSGVSFYDDSKATNIDAVLRAVEGFNQPLSIIMGGRDKGATFEIMLDALKKNTVLAVLIGEAAGKIDSAFKGHVRTVFAESMDDAVKKGFEAVSETGGAVLLSPACASFDMFNSYSHRGKVFMECAEKLIMEKRRNGE